MAALATNHVNKSHSLLFFFQVTPKMEESGSPSSALTQHQHETEGFSETGSEQPSGQSSASTIATLAEYNPSTSKGHEILSQVYQQSQVLVWLTHMS